MYWVEIRSAVHRRGPPKLVPLADVARYSGFRSIVAWDDSVAELIREQGGTQGLRGYPVYADTLFLDFDGHDPAEFREWLKGSGLAYEEYTSGGRSIHYHIPLVPVFGAWVTGAMKDWVKQHAPTADVSFYHNAGMYRLPRTFHAKHAGRCKALLISAAGRPLELPAPNKKPDLFQMAERGGAEELFLLLTQRKGEGHRSPHLWRIATTAAEAGCSFEEAVEHAKWWNEKFSQPPHDEATVIKQCESAFRRLARREA